MKTTTTQQKSLVEINDQISIIEQIKADLVQRIQRSDNRIHVRYLREKVRGLNTELRILYNIRSAFMKTISSCR